MADIQYAQLYYVRALLMNKRLADTIQRAWPNTQSSPHTDTELMVHCQCMLVENALTYMSDCVP